MELSKPQIECLIQRQRVYAKLIALIGAMEQLNEIACDVCGETGNNAGDVVIDGIINMRDKYFYKLLGVASKYLNDTPKIIQSK